ncbi:MAG TPA: hypothetical protein VGP61_04755, partial [Gemmatimonadales bacterium]|nr:hypothetical protein [Gemmatimonadales bacterium]
MKQKAPDDVALNVDAIHWRRLPASTRRGMVKAVDIVAAVRKRIQSETHVTSMPPVQIFDTVWMDPARTGFVNGRASVLRLGSRNVFGVELPAPTVLAAKEDLLHAVLVHEFGHCFYHATRVVDLIDNPDSAGPLALDMSRGFTTLYTDEAADRATLVAPSEWFTEDVARSFPYWNDPRLAWLDDEAFSWLKHLRVEDGGRRFWVESVSISEDWIEHIRRVRNRQTA